MGVPVASRRWVAAVVVLSVAEGGCYVASMAAKKVVPIPKKKSDGSSQRAESTRQMKSRPKKPVDRMPSPAKPMSAGQRASYLVFGPDNPNISVGALGVRSALARVVPSVVRGVRQSANARAAIEAGEVGFRVGGRVLRQNLSRLEGFAPSAGNVVKNTRSTIVTPSGVAEGAKSFLVTGQRTAAQMQGTVAGLTTKAAKDAARAGAYAARGARTGFKVGAAATVVPAALGGWVANTVSDRLLGRGTDRTPPAPSLPPRRVHKTPRRVR